MIHTTDIKVLCQSMYSLLYIKLVMSEYVFDSLLTYIKVLYQYVQILLYIKLVMSEYQIHTLT